MSQAFTYLSRMFSSPFEGMSVGSLKYTFFFVFLMLVAEWYQRDKQHALELVKCQGLLKYRIEEDLVKLNNVNEAWVQSYEKETGEEISFF